MFLLPFNLEQMQKTTSVDELVKVSSFFTLHGSVRIKLGGKIVSLKSVTHINDLVEFDSQIT